MDVWLYEIYNCNVPAGCARLAAGRGEVRIRNLTFHKVTLAAGVCNTVQYSAIYPALARPQLALWSSHPSNIVTVNKMSFYLNSLLGRFFSSVLRSFIFEPDAKQVRKLNWIAEHELSLLYNVNFIIFI